MLRFDPKTLKFKDVFVSDDGGTGRLDRPAGLVFDPRGKNLYVLSFRNNFADPIDNPQNTDAIRCRSTGSFKDKIDLWRVGVDERSFAAGLIFGPQGQTLRPDQRWRDRAAGRGPSLRHGTASSTRSSSRRHPRALVGRSPSSRTRTRPRSTTTRTITTTSHSSPKRGGNSLPLEGGERVRGGARRTRRRPSPQPLSLEGRGRGIPWKRSAHQRRLRTTSQVPRIARKPRIRRLNVRWSRRSWIKRPRRSRRGPPP